jgi:hypothetical protein
MATTLYGIKIEVLKNDYMILGGVLSANVKSNLNWFFQEFGYY